jgi:hypothetical protein
MSLASKFSCLRFVVFGEIADICAVYKIACFEKNIGGRKSDGYIVHDRIKVWAVWMFSCSEFCCC